MSNENVTFTQIGMLTGLKRHTINARARTMFKEEDLQRSTGNQILLNPAQVKSLLHDVIQELNGKVIYVGNLKGGVGKTTMVYLLANALSAMGLKTCAIDLDVQSNLTQQYISVDEEQPVFQDVIAEKISIKDVIVRLSDTLHIIPSSLRNSLIQKSLTMQSPKHHLRWFNDLCLDYLRENYNVILVDTPPSLTTLNSVFCLCLKENDHIVVPACAEDFSIMGIQMFLEDVNAIRESYSAENGPKISIIMNRFFQNQKTNLEMLVKMGQKYSDMLSQNIIRDNAKLREVVNNKIPLNAIKQGKEVFEAIFNLLSEFKIIATKNKH